MTPEQVAASYDRLAEQWLDLSAYGFAPVERAVAFVKRKGVALDVGCGTGRLMGLLGTHGFVTDGIDVSPAMIALARDRHPAGCSGAANGQGLPAHRLRAPGRTHTGHLLPGLRLAVHP